MNLIYTPKGKAREYSPLALNVYVHGCDHDCRYCYCVDFDPHWGATPQARELGALAADARKAGRQVLLSFMGDPYCHLDVRVRRTREALRVLRDAGCSVAVLTKGGQRCLRDIDLFLGWPGGRLQVGATLTLMDPSQSLAMEPGAALPADRLAALRALKEAGIKTWVSLEPVIDGEQCLAAIRASLPWIDAYAIGPLNPSGPGDELYADFCQHALAAIRGAGKRVYVKEAMRVLMPEAGFLRPEECDPETLFLPDAPVRIEQLALL